MNTRWDKRLIALLDEKGCPHEARTRMGGVREFYVWDGHSLATWDRRPDDIVHDLGHWLVCSPSRRKLLEFGLGGTDETRQRIISRRQLRVVSSKFSYEEEALASLLGLFYQCSIGMPFVGAVADQAWFEGGDDPMSPTARASADKLERRGLLKDPRLVKSNAVARVLKTVEIGRVEYFRAGRDPFNE